MSRKAAAAAVLVLVVLLAGAYYVSISTRSQGPSYTPTTPAGTSTSGTHSNATSSSATISLTTTLPTSAETSSVSTVSSTPTTTSSTVVLGPIKHVIVIVMENKEYGSIIGNSSAPYQNYLASHYASAANYYAIAHPSLPNYLAMVGGNTFGMASDCQPAQCSVAASNLASLLNASSLTWKEYAESMPANCSQTVSPDGLYAPKHNPFVYFQGITGNGGSGPTSSYCKSHVVSFDQFWRDLGAGDLPNFSFITPNMCDDAHDCPISTGDGWLSTVVPRIINSTSFSSTALFITYDEGSTNAGFGSNAGGKVLCVMVSPYAVPGYASQVQYSHYSLLATIETLLKVGNLGRNDAAASPMTDLFTKQVFP